MLGAVVLDASLGGLQVAQAVVARVAATATAATAAVHAHLAVLDAQLVLVSVVHRARRTLVVLERMRDTAAIPVAAASTKRACNTERTTLSLVNFQFILQCIDESLYAHIMYTRSQSCDYPLASDSDATKNSKTGTIYCHSERRIESSVMSKQTLIDFFQIKATNYRYIRKNAQKK